MNSYLADAAGFVLLVLNISLGRANCPQVHCRGFHLLMIEPNIEHLEIHVAYYSQQEIEEPAPGLQQLLPPPAPPSLAPAIFPPHTPAEVISDF